MIRTLAFLVLIGAFALAVKKLIKLLVTHSPNYDLPFVTFTTHQRFLDILISMLAKLAKVDGQVTQAEISRMEKVIYQDLGLEGSKAERAKKIFNHAKGSDVSFEQLAEDFKFLCYSKPYLRATMLETLCSLAASDGEISREEDRLIWTAARIFGFSQSRYWQIRDIYSQHRNKYHDKSNSNKKSRHAQTKPHGSPHEILGLKRGASESEIKRAYRKLVKEVHPDRAISQGLPEVVVESYERRFHEIQEAYEKLTS